MENLPSKLRIFDIAANLTEKRFKFDMASLLQRAATVGVEKFLLAGTELESSKKAKKLCENYENLYYTTGIHPCSAKNVLNTCEMQHITLDQYFEQLESLAKESDLCVAIGECGLDYDRFEYSSREE